MHLDRINIVNITNPTVSQNVHGKFLFCTFCTLFELSNCVWFKTQPAPRHYLPFIGFSAKVQSFPHSIPPLTLEQSKCQKWQLWLASSDIRRQNICGYKKNNWTHLWKLLHYWIVDRAVTEWQRKKARKLLRWRKEALIVKGIVHQNKYFWLNKVTMCAAVAEVWLCDYWLSGRECSSILEVIKESW